VGELGEPLALQGSMRLLKLHEEAPPPPAGPVQLPHHPRPWLVGLVVALVVAAVGTGVEYRLHARLVAPPLVFLAPVTRGPVAGRLHLSGTLEPTETRTVTQPMPGRATEVLVRAGDLVTAGQVVARFDPLTQRAELARTESRLMAAEADAFRAELLVARAEKQGGGDAEEALALARARLTTADAEIEARTASYQVAQRQLRDRAVRAPMTGVVLSRQVEPGQAVSGGEALLVIGAPPGRLFLTAGAAEPALATVSAGQPAHFTVPAFPGRTFTATVVRTGALSGPEGARHFPVLLEVPNDPGVLAVGMSATVELDTGRSGPVFRVPVAALAFSPAPGTGGSGEPAIWLGDARGNDLVRTPVEVGASDGFHVEVRAPGLTEGAMVAVAFGRAPPR
jgi:HlyD family secretion protein